MPRNPADRVVRARSREHVSFPDLSERMALKLVAVPHYVSRVHFAAWHRRAGQPDFANLEGVFTPLYFVDVEITDVPLVPHAKLRVHGETFLAHTLDDGVVDHVVREGRHEVEVESDGQVSTVARARLINVFTRYDPDPARRRVTELPPDMGLGRLPSRIIDLPTLSTLIPPSRGPDAAETEASIWHYGQTDPNRHVNGMEYLRGAESFAAEVLAERGQDMAALYFARARLLYRKPCFRGEGYRRLAWVRGEGPVLATVAFVKEADGAAARPAVAVELTVARHE